MGWCMDCKYFIPIEEDDWYEGMGDCNNSIYFHTGYDAPQSPARIFGAVIENDEGWGWHVGRKFGCIHWEEK